MNRSTLVRFVVLSATAMLIAACGGGGGAVAPEPTGGNPPPPNPPVVVGDRLPPDVHWQPPSNATPAAGNFIYLQSEAGDRMGKGSSFLYTQAESQVVYQFVRFFHEFHIGNPQLRWYGTFLPNESLRVGFYGGAQSPATRVSGHPGMLWSTEWRECEAMDGWFVVDSLTVDGEGLAAIEVRFAQRCGSDAGTLRGKIRWQRPEARYGPINPMPALWQPDASAVPAQGSYLYLESDSGDYVGRGQNRLFTKENSSLGIARYEFFYSIAANSGFDEWTGNLFGILEVPVRRGYYPGVQRYPDALASIGAMEWLNNRRGCGQVNGWFAVDDVVYHGDHIVYLELRFEQRCDASQAALRGKLKWSVSDFLPPPGPMAPIPGALWQPPSGQTPASGDFVYLQSEAGDHVGQGTTTLLTPTDASIQGIPYTNSFHIRIEDGSTWIGDFRTMDGVEYLREGLYGNLPGMAARSAQAGGLSWTRDGRSCDTSSGWVTIDRIARGPSGAVSEIEMRFEQRCDGDAGALRGKIRWSPASAPSLALNPSPAYSWQPPLDRLPTFGNYVYVESDLGDPIAEGSATLETPRNSVILAQGYASGPAGAPAFAVSLQPPDNWIGSFHLPSGARRLEAGFYGNLRGRSATDPSVTYMKWEGRGWTCGGEASSWFAVDRVVYDADAITDIELRFQQHCDGFPGSLRGKIRWTVSDTTPVPKPAEPPSGLWAPSVPLPAAGNYVYLESEYGDFVGYGRTTLLTADNAKITGSAFVNDLNTFRIAIDERTPASYSWHGAFSTMDSVPAFQVGFYDMLGREGFHNRAWGGIDWGGHGRGCNTVAGWFMVDSVQYTNGVLSAIELRFQQHCGHRSGRLRGKLRWTAADQ